MDSQNYWDVQFNILLETDIKPKPLVVCEGDLLLKQGESCRSWPKGNVLTTMRTFSIFFFFWIGFQIVLVYCKWAFYCIPGSLQSAYKVSIWLDNLLPNCLGKYYRNIPFPEQCQHIDNQGTLPSHFPNERKYFVRNNSRLAKCIGKIILLLFHFLDNYYFGIPSLQKECWCKFYGFEVKTGFVFSVEM